MGTRRSSTNASPTGAGRAGADPAAWLPGDGGSVRRRGLHRDGGARRTGRLSLLRRGALPLGGSGWIRACATDVARSPPSVRRDVHRALHRARHGQASARRDHRPARGRRPRGACGAGVARAPSVDRRRVAAATRRARRRGDPAGRCGGAACVATPSRPRPSSFAAGGWESMRLFAEFRCTIGVDGRQLLHSGVRHAYCCDRCQFRYRPTGRRAGNRPWAQSGWRLAAWLRRAGRGRRHR